MEYKSWLIKFGTPFLLVSYTCIFMAVVMLIRGDTGFGLLFIEFLFIFALCFILFDFGLKRLLNSNLKSLLLLEAIIALTLLIGSLYLMFKKSKHELLEINVEPDNTSK